MLNWFYRAVVIGCVSLMVLTGCRSEDLANKLNASEQARQTEGENNVRTVRDLYVKAMTSGLPAQGAKPPSPKDDSPMLVWRKSGSKTSFKLSEDREAGSLTAVAAAQFEAFKDTPSKGHLEDGMVLMKALQDYWLGRELVGLPEKKQWEEGYVEWKKTAPQKGARERVPLKEHEKLLKRYINQDDSPWKMVAEFELLLPYVMQSYRYEHAAGRRPTTTFTPYWVVMFELPLKISRTPEGHRMKEFFQDYRDRVCEGFGEACDVPYEYRGRVVRGVYIERVLARIEAFRKAYPDSGLAKNLDLMSADLAAHKKKCEVPEEYPVLAGTIAMLPTSRNHTTLVVGEKGVVLETDDPADPRSRKTTQLLPAREDWDLDDEENETLRKGFVQAVKALRDAGVSAASTDRLHVFADMEVPVGLIAGLLPALDEAGVRDLHLVGRRRHDGSKRLRANRLRLVDKESRTPIEANVTLKCTPLAGVGDSVPPVDWLKGVVTISRGKIRATITGGGSKTVSLNGDQAELSKLGAWLLALKQPVLLALRENTTQSDLHKVLNGLAWECPDGDCTKARSIDNILVGICL